MRGLIWLPLFLFLALPAAAKQAAPPHAWLFGAWTGGLYPPPVSLGAQDCLAQPTVIFTSDSVMRVVLTSPAYLQRLIETVRATRNGAVFRFVASAPPPPPGAFNLAPQGAGDAGFGCTDPDALQVQRRSENEIVFANCPAFPYPLTRCPTR